MQRSDEDLVARHLAGDPQAFAELVARHTGRLYNLAYRLTADQAEAEDIVQESFLRAFQALPRSQTGRAFKPWLFQIAVNRCRDWARRSRHRPLAFSSLEGVGLDEHDSPAESVPGLDPSPLEQVERDELGSALGRAVMALEEEDRVILTLRYNEGLSYAEMSQILEAPTGTIGTHLFRAKLRLRKALLGFLGEQPG